MADTATTTTEPGTDGGGTTTSTDAGADKTFTQADLERIVGERLARQRAQFGDVDALKEKASKFDELEQANKTETQRLTEKAQQDAERASRAETELARFKAAAEAGLDIKFASRIQGQTPEEMATDAKQLAEVLKPGPDPSQFDGGVRTSATDTSFDAAIRRRAGVG